MLLYCSLRRYTEKFDSKFIENMPQDDLLQVYYAAHYLDIKPLIELVMAHIACRFFKASHVSSKKVRATRFRNDFGIGARIDPKIIQEKGVSKIKKIIQDPFANIERDEWHRENMWLSQTTLPEHLKLGGNIPSLDGISMSSGLTEITFVNLTLESYDNRKVTVKDTVVRQRLSDIFQEFDKDANAVLDKNELAQMIQAIQNRGKIDSKFIFEPFEIDAIVKSFDENNDGLIDEQEFLNWCIKGLMKFDRSSKSAHERFQFRKTSSFASKLDTFLTAIERIVTETYVSDSEDNKIMKELGSLFSSDHTSNSDVSDVGNGNVSSSESEKEHGKEHLDHHSDTSDSALDHEERKNYSGEMKEARLNTVKDDKDLSSMRLGRWKDGKIELVDDNSDADGDGSDKERQNKYINRTKNVGESSTAFSDPSSAVDNGNSSSGDANDVGYQLAQGSNKNEWDRTHSSSKKKPIQWTGKSGGESNLDSPEVSRFNVIHEALTATSIQSDGDGTDYSTDKEEAISKELNNFGGKLVMLEETEFSDDSEEIVTSGVSD